MYYTPAITDVSPASARVGEEITVTGLRLGPTEELASVTLNGVVCPIVSWSNTSVTCKIPHTTSGSLVVTTLTNNVVDYGAVGDGTTDDTAAIQDAIDDLPPNGSILYFPAGTYKVKATGAGTYAILHLADTNIKVMGDGSGVSTIKVANACPTHKWVLGPSADATDLTGLEICNLTFDHNIANNPITNEPETANWPEITCGTYMGSDINIHDLEVINASSRNNIMADDVAMSDVTIRNITCSNIGDDPNHIVHDASFIYVSADTYSISNCDLSCASEGLPAGQCSMEAHGTDFTVSNNIVTNFWFGMNICGISEVTASNVVVENNDMSGCTIGIYVWSRQSGSHTTGYGIDGAIIKDNTVDLIPYGGVGDTDTRSGVFLDASANLPINDLTIDNNIIGMVDYESVPGGAGTISSGIGWYSTGDMELSNSAITNNQITNFPQCGIRFDCNLDHVSITDNNLVNCGSTLNAGVPVQSKSAIYIDGVNIDTLDISDNAFTDDIALTRIPYWVYLQASTSSADFTITGNTYSLTGDRAGFLKAIEIIDNITQPLITETIPFFAPPIGTVDVSSTILHTGASHYIITAWTGTAAPKDWTFQGSPDDINWTTLDTQTGVAFADDESKVCLFTDTTNYRYYKLDITANNGNAFSTRLFELKIVRNGDSWTTADGLIWSGGIVSIMTSDNAPAPFVASASDEHAGLEAFKAFNGNFDYASSWQADDVTGWLEIDLGA